MEALDALLTVTKYRTLGWAVAAGRSTMMGEKKHSNKDGSARQHSRIGK